MKNAFLKKPTYIWTGPRCVSLSVCYGCTHLNDTLISFPSQPLCLFLSSNCELGLALSLFIFLTVLLLLLTAVTGINSRSQEVNGHKTTQYF